MTEETPEVEMHWIDPTRDPMPCGSGRVTVCPGVARFVRDDGKTIVYVTEKEEKE